MDAALPNFHEHFITASAQPFIEYEYRVTRDISVEAGMKVAQYGMSLTQYQDNGTQAVGCLGGVLTSKTITPSTTCIGGAPSTFHEAQYRS